MEMISLGEAIQAPTVKRNSVGRGVDRWKIIGRKKVGRSRKKGVQPKRRRNKVAGPAGNGLCPRRQSQQRVIYERCGPKEYRNPQRNYSCPRQKLEEVARAGLKKKIRDKRR